MKTIYNKLYNFIFPKRVCGKTYIEESMTAKYGSDWLEQCLEGLKNSEVRKKLRTDLNL